MEAEELRRSARQPPPRELYSSIEDAMMWQVRRVAREAKYADSLLESASASRFMEAMTEPDSDEALSSMEVDMEKAFSPTREEVRIMILEDDAQLEEKQAQLDQANMKASMLSAENRSLSRTCSACRPGRRGFFCATSTPKIPVTKN